jgi:hypothetical protein
MRNIIHVAGKLVTVLLLGITVAGCATTQYGIEISNVQNIREIYIRNAGTTNWGTNIASNVQNIDKSIFSESVDISVIDTNGVAYSRYNVPFNDAVFVETDKKSSINLFAGLGLAGAILAVVILIPKPAAKQGE